MLPRSTVLTRLQSEGTLALGKLGILAIEEVLAIEDVLACPVAAGG